MQEKIPEIIDQLTSIPDYFWLCYQSLFFFLFWEAYHRQTIWTCDQWLYTFDCVPFVKNQNTFWAESYCIFRVCLVFCWEGSKRMFGRKTKHNFINKTCDTTKNKWDTTKIFINPNILEAQKCENRFVCKLIFLSYDFELLSSFIKTILLTYTISKFRISQKTMTLT